MEYYKEYRAGREFGPRQIAINCLDRRWNCGITERGAAGTVDMSPPRPTTFLAYDTILPPKDIRKNNSRFYEVLYLHVYTKFSSLEDHI